MNKKFQRLTLLFFLCLIGFGLTASRCTSNGTSDWRNVVLTGISQISTKTVDCVLSSENKDSLVIVKCLSKEVLAYLGEFLADMFRPSVSEIEDYVMAFVNSWLSIKTPGVSGDLSKSRFTLVGNQRTVYNPVERDEFIRSLQANFTEYIRQH